MSDVAGYVQRKTMLYQTGVEYGDYTMNFVQGCSHGCKFPCYAFMMKKRFGQIKSYEEWCHPYLVSNTLELLDKEIPAFEIKDQIRAALLLDRSLYVWISRDRGNGADIHQEAQCCRIKCTVLTKGILPASLAQLVA